MKLEYDIFEQQGDGVVWRGVVAGLYNVRLKLAELAESTGNECFAMHTPTKEVVARVNTARPAQ